MHRSVYTTYSCICTAEYFYWDGDRINGVMITGNALSSEPDIAININLVIVTIEANQINITIDSINYNHNDAIIIVLVVITIGIDRVIITIDASHIIKIGSDITMVSTLYCTTDSCTCSTQH